MDREELLKWIEEGSTLTRTLALLVLDDKLNGEVLRILRKESERRWQSERKRAPS